MIRITNILVVAAIITLPTLAIDGVQALRQPPKKDKKIKIEIKPAYEVVNRFQNVALAPVCPRSADSFPDTPTSATDNTEEHDHCPHCRMGVFFHRAEGNLTCSYCEAEKQG